MVTSRLRSGLSKADREYVARDGIAVLTCEDLLVLADGVENGWGVEETLAVCRARLPSRAELVQTGLLVIPKG